jgi:CO dehydrogenase maturation factor
MRIAIAGKGGTGKTTIAGTLARLLAREGRAVLAVDADTNPNLAVTLGVPASRTREIAPLPLDLLERRTDSDGSARTVFAANPDDVIRNYAASAADGVQLLVMGRVDHSGAG